MSSPEPIIPRCEACGEPSVGEYPEGFPLCAHHLKEAKRWRSLEADLLGVVNTWAQKHNLSPQELYETVEAISDRTTEAADEARKSAPDHIAKRSHGPRDSYEGGFRRPFDVVPEQSLEQVRRDATITFGNVPLWGVQELFDRVHKELGRPDVRRVEAHLIIDYTNLDEALYEQLYGLEDTYGWNGLVQVETTNTRLYPPRHLAEQRMREVEKERSENPRE